MDHPACYAQSAEQRASNSGELHKSLVSKSGVLDKWELLLPVTQVLHAKRCRRRYIVRMLGAVLGDAIREQDGEEVFRQIENIRRASVTSTAKARLKATKL